MKTNMGKVFTTLLCMMMCLSLYAQEFTLGMVVGSWNFSAPDAPYGYQKGTCQIKKTGENLSAVFTINGEELGRPSRTCLLCKELAHACSRSRRHSVAELTAEIGHILKDL